MHRHGKIVGIWIDAIAPFEEDYAYYEKAYELKVDMVTTDFPEVAHRILMEIHKKHLMEELSNNSVMNI
jgi:glycerophosphoryl diester phosphodiesterase